MTTIGEIVLLFHSRVYTGLWIVDNTTSYTSIVTLSFNLSSLWAPSRVITDNGTDASFQHSVDGQLKCWYYRNSFHCPQGDCDGTVTSSDIDRGHINDHENDVLGSVVV